MIYKQFGIFGLYRGFGPTLMRDGFGYAWYFSVYDWTIKKLTKNSSEKPGFAKISLAGAIAGNAYWFTSFTNDTIKTLYQTDNLKNPKNRNVFQAYRLAI